MRTANPVFAQHGCEVRLLLRQLAVERLPSDLDVPLGDVLSVIYPVSQAVNKAHDVLQRPRWAAFVWIAPSDGESQSQPTARRQHSIELSEPGLVVFKATLTPDHRKPFVLEGQACSISGAESDKMIQPREPGYLAGRCDEGLGYVDARHAALKGLGQLDGRPT